ncbi:MAG TPA: cysteine hydrolase [Caulobacteraceae bacterium]|nr:cysteine hydrolase [Caulobacteraceae bacterium]
MHRIRLPRWAVERGAPLNRFDGLEPRTALVVIDMQTAFVAEDQVFGNAHARDIVPAVNVLAHAFRAAGRPVIWTRQTQAADGPGAPAPWQYDPADPFVARALAALAPGSEGHALHPLMEVGGQDTVVDKHRYGAFSCPVGALRRTLEAQAVGMLVICGTLTNVCCESTAREAYMAGYKTLVVADAMAAVTDAEHNAALMNLRLNFADVRRTAEVIRMLGRT